MVVCEDFGALQGVSTKGLVANLASMGIEQVGAPPALCGAPVA
jgi:hypothetical protein